MDRPSWKKIVLPKQRLLVSVDMLLESDSEYLWRLSSRGIRKTFDLLIISRFREVDTTKHFTTRTREMFAKDIKKIKSTAKGFSTFGMAFAFFECLLEHVN